MCCVSWEKMSANKMKHIFYKNGPSHCYFLLSQISMFLPRKCLLLTVWYCLTHTHAEWCEKEIYSACQVGKKHGTLQLKKSKLMLNILLKENSHLLTLFFMSLGIILNRTKNIYIMRMSMMFAFRIRQILIKHYLSSCCCSTE